MQNGELKTTQLIAYAGPMIPLSIMLMQLIVYIPPFYAAELGVDIAVVGGIFFFARAWDAIIDPVIGSLSDRIDSPWGRRKPWMAVGVPFLIVLFYLFCQPPEGIGTGYLAITAFLFYIIFTIVQIPYLSWGAELSRDYEGRTRVTAFREGGLMLGTIIATSTPLMALPLLGITQPSLRDILFILAIVTISLLIVTTPIALRIVPRVPVIAKVDHNIFVSFSVLRRNKPLLRLLTGVFLLWLGGSVFKRFGFVCC